MRHLDLLLPGLLGCGDDKESTPDALKLGLDTILREDFGLAFGIEITSPTIDDDFETQARLRTVRFEIVVADLPTTQQPLDMNVWPTGGFSQTARR
tara:strand:- start:230 stop:517 length:288 start_codon:yes stop_codon:yes gene_type:complete